MLWQAGWETLRTPPLGELQRTSYVVLFSNTGELGYGEFLLMQTRKGPNILIRVSGNVTSLRCYINLNTIKLSLDRLQNNRLWRGKDHQGGPHRPRERVRLAWLLKWANASGTPQKENERIKTYCLGRSKSVTCIILIPLISKSAFLIKTCQQGKSEQASSEFSRCFWTCTASLAVTNVVSCTSGAYYERGWAVRHPRN